MNLEHPTQLGGLAALVAGVLLFFSQLLGDLPQGLLPFKLYGDELSISNFGGINVYLGILIVVLVQLGLVGLYAPQARVAGALGVIGFFIAFFGGRLVLTPLYIYSISKPFVPPPGTPSGWSSSEIAIDALIFIVGWMVFAIATLRTGIYPRAAVGLLIIGTLILFLPVPFGGIIFAAALSWMGYLLFRGKVEEAPRSAKALGQVMNVEDPVRLGGLAALVAGVLLIVSELLEVYSFGLYPAIYGQPFLPQGAAAADRSVGLLLAVLLQLGLIGIYVSQARVTGVLGTIGFFLAFVGAWFGVGGLFGGPFARTDLFEWPSEIECEEFCGPLVAFALTVGLGWILFGVATIRGGIYPRQASALLIAGAAIVILPLPLSGVIFAVALTWIGHLLFKGRIEEAT